jgi:hypothetical protein
MGLLNLQSIWMLIGSLLDNMLSCVKMKRLFISRDLGFSG